MHCPFCRHGDSRVVDSRGTEDGLAIRRRRQCQDCGRRFSTLETAALTVIKRSGATEPFSRLKIITGVRRACQGRPVDEDDLALLAHRVEEQIRTTGVAEIDAHEIGLSILGPLRELDEVAYLRFASVYQAFASLEDFEAAIAVLRARTDPTAADPQRATAPRSAAEPQRATGASGTAGPGRATGATGADGAPRTDGALGAGGASAVAGLSTAGDVPGVETAVAVPGLSLTGGS